MEIEPKTQAVAFDIACAMKLQEWDDERNAAFLQAQMAGFDGQSEMKFKQVRM